METEKYERLLQALSDGDAEHLWFHRIELNPEATCRCYDASFTTSADSPQNDGFELK